MSFLVNTIGISKAYRFTSALLSQATIDEWQRAGEYQWVLVSHPGAAPNS